MRSFKCEIYIAVLLILSLDASAQIPTLTFLNDSTAYTDRNSNLTLSFSANITFEQNPSHTLNFKAGVDAGSADADIEYLSGNTTGFLARIHIDDTGDGSGGDIVSLIDCINTSKMSELCSGNGCGDLNLLNVYNFTFNSYANNFNLKIGPRNLGNIGVCTNATMIKGVRFYLDAGGGYTTSNNILTADNRPPRLIGTIYNITTPEETPVIINISGNFTDLDGQNLTFGFDSSSIENITITVNETTGIANITPDINFFGIRHVKFFANDSMNITFSNNVTINVTNVNDVPSVSGTMLNNTDFLNRTNGSLITGWAFRDIDNDLPQGNETKWYRNGAEIANLANLTLISPQNTTKGEAWIFSISAFDGSVWSAWTNSSEITIKDAAPFFSPPLQDLSSEKSDRLFYDINYTELDNDGIAFYLNTTEFGISDEGIIDYIFPSIGNRTINITIGDNSFNTSQAILIEIKDTNPPKITSISVSSSGSSSVDVTLSAATDENAVCRYSASDINYSEMQAMSSTSSTSHSNSLSYSLDSSGIYYVRCNDTLGFVMNFSNSTGFSADVQDPSPPAAASPSSGDSGGWQCRYRWECSQWTECIEGRQTRDCRIEKVVPFYSETKCEYMEEAETEKECKSAVEQEEIQEMPSASLESGNMGAQQSEAGESETPTGGVILDVEGGSKKAFGIASLALLVSSILLYAGFSHSRLFKKSQLSEEEMRKLRELMGKYEKP